MLGLLSMKTFFFSDLYMIHEKKINNDNGTTSTLDDR